MLCLLSDSPVIRINISLNWSGLHKTMACVTFDGHQLNRTRFSTWLVGLPFRHTTHGCERSPERFFRLVDVLPQVRRYRPAAAAAAPSTHKYISPTTLAFFSFVTKMFLPAASPSTTTDESISSFPPPPFELIRPRLILWPPKWWWCHHRHTRNSETHHVRLFSHPSGQEAGLFRCRNRLFIGAWHYSLACRVTWLSRSVGYALYPIIYIPLYTMAYVYFEFIECRRLRETMDLRGVPLAARTICTTMYLKFNARLCPNVQSQCLLYLGAVSTAGAHYQNLSRCLQRAKKNKY